MIIFPHLPLMQQPSTWSLAMVCTRAFSWGQREEKCWLHSFSIHIREKTNPKVTQWLKILCNKLAGTTYSIPLSQSLNRKDLSFIIMCNILATKNIICDTTNFCSPPLFKGKQKMKGDLIKNIKKEHVFSYPNTHPAGQKSMISLNFFALNTSCKAIYFTNNICKQEQNYLVSSHILLTMTALRTKKKGTDNFRDCFFTRYLFFSFPHLYIN